MKALSIIFVLLLSIISASAEEAKVLDDEPGDLKFLDGKGKYIYTKYVPKAWISKDYRNNVKNKYLRSLTEFKVDKKYCLHGSKNWDDKCQDAAMKYAFGEHWREYKAVLMEYLEDKPKTVEDFKRVYEFPMYITCLAHIYEDGYQSYRVADIYFNAQKMQERYNRRNFTSNFYKYNIKYKDLMINEMEIGDVCEEYGVSMVYPEHMDHICFAREYDGNNRRFTYPPKIRFMKYNCAK